jgi:hypothetical protein
MVVELIGGPLDGAFINGPADMPVYVIVTSHQDGPIYRASCCLCCAQKRRTVPYKFLGYEEKIRYEFPEKSQNIKAIEQENAYFSDTERGARS